jgi:hypothetical protein
VPQPLRFTVNTLGVLEPANGAAPERVHVDETKANAVDIEERAFEPGTTALGNAKGIGNNIGKSREWENVKKNQTGFFPRFFGWLFRLRHDKDEGGDNENP